MCHSGPVQGGAKISEAKVIFQELSEKFSSTVSVHADRILQQAGVLAADCAACRHGS